MRKTADGFKWLSVSITVASLVVVFWVWPAWNAGPQSWYWGNNEDSINTMYRNAYPPSGHNAPFQFEGSPTEWFTKSFMANEAANQMLAFGPDPWQYHIEWYLDPMMGFMPTGMEMVMFSLTIGRWSGMGTMMMYVPYFSAMGSGPANSMTGGPFSITGEALPTKMDSFAFMPGDILGAMVMFMTSTPFPVGILLANSCLITSGLSDAGYPGVAGLSVPTLSQWGTLALAILLPMLYPFVIKRRIRIGHS